MIPIEPQREVPSSLLAFLAVLEIEHALALLIVLDTGAAITARTSSKTPDLVSTCKSVFPTVSQHGAQLPLPRTYQSPRSITKVRVLTLSGHSLHEQKPMPLVKFKLNQTSTGERKRSARWRILRSISLKTGCHHLLSEHSAY